MPVLYKPFQSALANKAGVKLFYPRVVLKGNVGTDQIAQEIAEYSSLSKGDTKNSLDNLITVMSKHLQASESVTVDGLGTFHLVMKSGGKGVATADGVSPMQSTMTVRFQPCTTRNLNHTVATRSLVTGVRCIRYNESDATAAGGGEKPGGEGGGGGNQEENPLG